MRKWEEGEKGSGTVVIILVSLRLLPHMRNIFFWSPPHEEDYFRCVSLSLYPSFFAIVRLCDIVIVLCISPQLSLSLSLLSPLLFGSPLFLVSFMRRERHSDLTPSQTRDKAPPIPLSHITIIQIHNPL